MPYIGKKMRVELDAGRKAPASAGELNYVITSKVDQFISAGGGITYSALNEAIGVLECAKLELYRRLAAPYEDSKAAVNGDVYKSKPAKPSGG